MTRHWRGLLLAGVALEVLAATVPGCGGSDAKKKVPLPYSGDSGAAGEAPSAAGANTAGASAGGPAAGGEGGAPSEGGAAGVPEGGGTGGTAGSGGTSGTAGTGGAVLTGCALGDACCTGNACESSLACLGAACSCVADLSEYYMVRTDGIAFATSVHEQAQTVISNADTGLPLRGIKQIMGSLYHGCALLDSGAVRCWLLPSAANNDGQLGNGTVSTTPDTPYSATLVKLDATTNLANVVSIGEDSMIYGAAATTCSATSDGSAYCWGDYSGGIIPGATAFVPFATQIKTAAAGPALTGVTQVAVGQSHACALTNGKVRCWGQGTGFTAARPYPTTDIPVPGTVLKIVAGFGVSYALSDNDGGSVYAWGNNNGGKLGIGDPAASGYTADTPVRVRLDAATFLKGVSDLVASYDGACVVRTDHSLLCWGSAMYFATPMAVGGVVKNANNVAITDAVKVSAPNNSTIPRYVTTSGVEYSEGLKITPNCAAQE